MNDAGAHGILPVIQSVLAPYSQCPKQLRHQEVPGSLKRNPRFRLVRPEHLLSLARVSNPCERLRFVRVSPFHQFFNSACSLISLVIAGRFADCLWFVQREACWMISFHVSFLFLARAERCAAEPPPAEVQLVHDCDEMAELPNIQHQIF
jgi:hypothetical protein